MTRTRKAVLWLVGVPLALFVVVLAVSAWWISSLSQTEVAEPAAAAAAFEAVRARFIGEPAALESRRGRLVVVREPAPSTAVPAPAAVHLLVWKPDSRRLSRLALPFWTSSISTEPIPIEGLAQMTQGSLMGLLDAKRQGDELNLRLSDLQRYGRTLLLDATASDGGRVVMWNE